MVAQIIPIASALAAAVWSVWTWSDEQQKERQVKRDREAALYVNAFIETAEILQSKLYRILEEDELAIYKKEYPNQYESGSPAAIAILYSMIRYFGWAQRTYRYGPYTRDPQVIELGRTIADTFESRKFPGDAFRFDRDDKISLGSAVLRRTGEATAILPVFDSLTLHQFAEEVNNKESKNASLYRSRAVRSTLTAIDRADRADALEGHERLAVVQNLLVDLLAVLESKEGFSVAVGARSKARLKGVQGLISPVEASPAMILHQTRGRIRMRIPRLKGDDAYANRLQSLLESLEDVTSIRMNTSVATATIYYSPDIPDAAFAQKAMKMIEVGSAAA